MSRPEVTFIKRGHLKRTSIFGDLWRWEIKPALLYIILYICNSNSINTWLRNRTSENEKSRTSNTWRRIEYFCMPTGSTPNNLRYRFQPTESETSSRCTQIRFCSQMHYAKSIRVFRIFFPPDTDSRAFSEHNLLPHCNRVPIARNYLSRHSNVCKIFFSARIFTLCPNLNLAKQCHF